MRRRHRLLAPVLVLGGVVSATGGATIVDMPPPPTPAARSGDALDRYAGQRGTPAYTSMASPARWGWPYGRYGHGAYPYWSPGWCGWGFRSPYFGYRRHGTGLSFRGRPR